MPRVQSKTDRGSTARRLEPSWRPARPLLRCMGRSVIAICAIAVLSLVAGFGWFLWNLPADEIMLQRDADGIVVLTGGASHLTRLPELVGTRAKLMSGCHQPVETITGTEVPAAWFASGLRILDIDNPHALREVAHYLPDVPPGADRVSSNDVFVDARGLIYLIDRNRGLSILERA